MVDTTQQASVRRLDLCAVDVTDPLHWRWILVDPDAGRQLAEHAVALDRRRWEVAAFIDLHTYLSWRAEPDRRVASAAEVVARLGGFIAREVLGPAVMAELGGHTPVRLRIRVAEATFLTALPLELAHLDGVPLAQNERVQVSFRVTADRAPTTTSSATGVRLLAVFSLPTGTTALRLRSERQQLTQLVRQLALPVELEIVQWGVTREVLADRMARDGGPDVLHLSGHGRHSRLLLEGPGGAPDEIDASSVVDLLRPGGGRLRLVFLSACESAAAPPRWVDLDQPGPQVTDLAAAPASLGVRLARELDCTVLAMRYPVTDDVAGELAIAFYTGLVDSGLDAGAAAAQAVRKVAAAGVSAARPALSLAAPVLIGPDDVTLLGAGLLTAPASAQPVAADPLTGFTSLSAGSTPAAPDRFVGREQLMTLAGAGLRPDGGTPVIVLTGMAAVGKTACAVELVHRHQADFGSVVFWSAPERDADQQDTAAAFVDAVDRGVGDAVVFPLVAADDQQGWVAAVAELLDQCDQQRALLVLDNAESLLTASGRWRDRRWLDLLTMLAARSGPTRLLVTSRIPPAAPTGAGVRQLSVEPLSDSEASALVRQLPNLRRLLHIDDPAGRPESGGSTSADDVAHRVDRALVNAVLATAQGHPKLLELADAAAAEPAELSRLLQVTGQPADGERWLGETLTGWTRETTRRLDPAALLMVQMLAAVEPAHRFPGTIRVVWEDVWKEVGLRTAAPPSDAMLSVLAAAALTQPRTLVGSAIPAGADVTGTSEVIRYELHPAVAATVRADTSEQVAGAVDVVLADSWQQVAQAQQDRGDRENTSVVVGAYLAAVPYLLRQSSFARAAGCLGAALARDTSPRTARMALSYAAALAPATPGRDLVLAMALQPLDPVEAERLLRQELAAPDEEVAALAAGALANQLHQQGRLAEALELAERHEQLVERAGPWRRAGARVTRLWVLHERGETGRALTEVTALLDELPMLSTEQTAPDWPGDVAWIVRRAALSLAVSAALALELWQVALDHNQLLLDSVQRRGAAEAEVASFWFNDAHALIQLGRFDEARKVLRYCQRVFDEHGAELSLSRAIGTGALLAAKQGNLTEAVALEQTALRLGYRHPLAADLAAGHHLLGNHLGKLGSDPAGQLGHHLAAALLTRITGSALLPRFLHTIASDLHTYGQSWQPADLAALAARVGRVDGVRLLDVVHALLATDPAEQDRVVRGAEASEQCRNRAEEQFRGLLADVRRAAEEQGFDLAGNLLRWEGLMSMIAVAAAGDAQANRQLTTILGPMEPDTHAGRLAAAIRRVVGGERDDVALIADLHPADAAVIRRVLATLRWRETVRGCPEGNRLALTEADYRAAVDAEDHVRAGLRAAELSGLLRVRKQFAEALPYADHAIVHRRRAGFGLWSQRFDLGRRLQLFDDLCRWEEVLTELAPLRDELRGEPDLPSRTDPVNPSTVRDQLLTLGMLAAVALRNWELALEFHDDLTANMQLRGAGPVELALHKLDRVTLLSPLRRISEISKVYDEVRAVISGNLDAETRAKFDVALDRAGKTLAPEAPWRRQALADAYIGIDSGDVSLPLIAQEHYYFAIGDGPAETPTAKASHLLASAIICTLDGQDAAAELTVRYAAPHLYQPDGTRATPTLDSIVAVVEEVPGVRFGELVTQMIGTPPRAAAAVADAVHAAYRIPVAELFGLDQAIADHEAAIVAVAAAYTGGLRDRTACEPILVELAAKPDGAPLAAALRRAAAGNLLSVKEQEAMHPVHAAIIGALRSRIGRQR
ncbi:AAA family ATPase [Micromonospora taraxaci]|uniref:AAA family ATPase n=1 Tax=Micromonospora taraxaci TaxID=1316803 RepID=UPI0033F46825